MPQYDNKELIGLILKTSIGIIGRRTSEAFANVIVSNAIKSLKNQYSFLKYIHIKGTKYSEIFEIISIDQEIEEIDKEIIGITTRKYIENIILSMGKNAGYYFIKEIKEDLPFSFIESIKEIGVDLDYLQLKFITEIKEFSKYKIENHDIFKNVFKKIFEILDRNIGRNSAYLLLNEFITRLQMEYPILRYVKINDLRSIQNVDIVTIDNAVDQSSSTEVGGAIQKVVQELNSHVIEKYNLFFIDTLKNSLYDIIIFKLEEIGVNFDIIQLKKISVFKHVLKALVEVLSNSSTENYAIVMVNNIIRKFEDKFEFLKIIKIDSLQYSENLDGIIVPSEIETVRQSDIGRSIQKIIEGIVKLLGEDAGRYFIDKLKDQLGKAYLLRIEEMGVNLHLIELRRNFSI